MIAVQSQSLDRAGQVINPIVLSTGAFCQDAPTVGVGWVTQWLPHLNFVNTPLYLQSGVYPNDCASPKGALFKLNPFFTPVAGLRSTGHSVVLVSNGSWPIARLRFVQHARPLPLTIQ
jgi:hypothetical protein